MGGLLRISNFPGAATHHSGWLLQDRGMRHSRIAIPTSVFAPILLLNRNSNIVDSILLAVSTD
jgi:hypothetical protein